MQSGGNLARLRKERGLSQRQVARRLDVTRQAVSHWESGRAFPSMEKQLVLCRLYGVPVEALYPDGAPEEENVVTVEEAPPESLPSAGEEPQEKPPRQHPRRRIWLVPALVIICISIHIWGRLTRSMASARVMIVTLICALIVGSILHTFFQVSESLINYLGRKKS